MNSHLYYYTISPHSNLQTELLYTACITLGFTSFLWKVSKTIFIPVNCKTNHQDPRSFQPISLTYFFFKTLEKLMLQEPEQQQSAVTLFLTNNMKRHNTITKKKLYHSNDKCFQEYCVAVILLKQKNDKNNKFIICVGFLHFKS